MARARAPALIVLTAVLLRLVLGPGAVGYDASWALEWGREALAGTVPSFDTAGAPTPHPLSNAVAVVLAPLGARAGTALMGASWLSLAAIAYFAFVLGRRLYSPWVGALFGLILVTRVPLVRETQQAMVDVPFLALVMAALAAEAARPREGLRVPVLLGVAGLLRPEAWLLGAAWLAWAAPVTTRARLARAAAVIFAAPLLWALQDVLVTGDPLHSLRGTRELASELGRPTEVGTALRAAPTYLRLALGDVVFWLGLAGAVAALVLMRRRSVLPAAVMALGLAGFLVLGVAGLPLLGRYLLLPAMMLALFAALAALGWTASRERWWIAGGAAAVVALLAAAPGQVRALEQLRDATTPRVEAHRDLRRLADHPAVRSAAERCGPLFVPDVRLRPLLAAWLERAPSTLPPGGEGRKGSFVVFADVAVEQGFAAGAPAGTPAQLPQGARAIARNRSWLFGTRC